VTEQVNAEVASEAMRWLGHIDHPITYRSRLHLLERSLHNSSARVRDGAGLGLASLDDPHAIPYLKQAIEREQYQELRHDLKQVVIQLESTYI
jgi:HEAT repeat protein